MQTPKLHKHQTNHNNIISMSPTLVQITARVINQQVFFFCARKSPFSAIFILPRRGSYSGEIQAKQGLPSADRNDKATLLLTGPFRTARSSAKDLIPHVPKLQYANYRRTPSGPAALSPAEIQCPGGPILIVYSAREVSPLSGMDSDLEAFSHYPADGSAAALPCRATANTNYLNQRFLSY